MPCKFAEHCLYKMSSTLIEVFGHIVFSFTRNVTEHYNPTEPDFTAESFGYDPLQSTGLEWNYLPVDELIYQEHEDNEVTSPDYFAASSLNVRVLNACLSDEKQEIQDEQQNKDRAMAWKRLRPSAICTVCRSMYIGALISPLSATIIGSLYMLIFYISYQTELNCQFHSHDSIPLKIQWIRTLSQVIACVFLYMWFFIATLFLFRPYQLKGVKRKLIFVVFLMFCLDTLYRVLLQAYGISHSKISTLKRLPLNFLFLISICWQVYLLTNHFRILSRGRRPNLFLKILLPSLVTFLLGILITSFIYPVYNKQNGRGKLVIALFSPLSGVIFKAISRICVQRLWNITHPGYSYVLLVSWYFGSAIIFRVLQADLDSLQSIAILGIVHGFAEVIERSTMVFIDHIFHAIWKKKSVPWGNFRTPRRERLMADVAIISMLYESAGIVSVNGGLYLYQLIYLRSSSLLKLLQEFAFRTSVQLVIEWFFTSVSLAIETHYQNMAVMAVWRKRWKRHFLVGVVNAVPLALWTSNYLIEIVNGRFNEADQPCKMPFT